MKNFQNKALTKKQLNDVNGGVGVYLNQCASWGARAERGVHYLVSPMLAFRVLINCRRHF